MKEYQSPIIIEEEIELADVIAKSVVDNTIFGNEESANSLWGN